MLNCFLISARETDEPYGSQNAFAFPDMVPARVVLYMLSFSGFTVSFMMRNDINIAMVAMVKPSPNSSSDDAITSQHCYATPNSSYYNNNTVARNEVEWPRIHDKLPIM